VDQLLLSGDILHRLLEHARAELPNEACALLGGDPVSGTVTSLHLAANAAASPYRFELDPADLVRVVHAIEAAGEELIAIFHSHPATSPEPSSTDLREARYDVVNLIAGTASAAAPMGALRAWRFSNGRGSEVPIGIRAPG
jgi:[CysO sulfur-carrier protein]-S-L-cysteine hydrolase